MELAWLSGGELLLALVVGLLLFGGRLPQVARDWGKIFLRARRTLDDLRRESGIDETLRDLERESRRVREDVPDFREATDFSAGPVSQDAPVDVEAELAPQAQAQAQGTDEADPHTEPESQREKNTNEEINDRI